jgi:predicted extracellular nuclease
LAIVLYNETGGASYDTDSRAATRFVFNALSGSLDHAVSTDVLTGKVTGLAHWNINAVESFAHQYDGDPALFR